MSNADRMPPHQILVMIVCLLMVTLLVPSAKAQLIVFSKQDLVDYTPQNPFDRFPDGRPKVPDDLIGESDCPRKKFGRDYHKKVSTISTRTASKFFIPAQPWSAAPSPCNSCRCGVMLMVPYRPKPRRAA